MKKRKIYRLKISDLPKSERPRERLASLGPQSLSNAELIAAIIGIGSKKENVLSLAQRLTSKYDLHKLSSISISELKGNFGINDAKACQLLAAMELGKRSLFYSKTKMQINTSEDIAKVFQDMKNLKREILKAVYIDSKLNILKHDTISIGILNSNEIKVSELFRNAISEGAHGIILVHNHPSGDSIPSEADVKSTKELVKAGKFLGIQILDHIIIGDNYFSFKENKLI